jgi:hypothetical protein
VWVEGGDIQDELLDQLGGVLAPPADLWLTPSAEELEALALAVAARWPQGAAEPTPVGPGPDQAAAETDGEVRRLRWAGPRSRRIGASAWRAGSVAAGIVVFSASAAAAANGGVPLPRPVRVVAYTVGLPVDSPALDDTNQHIKELKEAVKANDTPKADATVRRLQKDLTKVPADEKKEAKPKVDAAIAEAAKTIPSLAPTTTTTAPPTTTTTVTAPASSTTATTAEENEKEKEKDRSTVTTTTGPTTTTTEPPTTTTTAPETDGTTPGGTTGDPGTGDGHTGAGDGGDPGTTPTTVPDDTTTTTTTAPPPETTTTTTTAPPPETTTTTTTAPPVAP